MNKAIGKVFIFAAGAILGSAVAWKLAKTKYERLAQEEIDSVKKMVARRTKKQAEELIWDKESEDEKKGMDKVIDEAAKLQQKEHVDYASYYTPEYDTEKEKTEEGGPETMRNPYVIPPEEFGDIEEYDKIELTLYQDQILADDMDELVENVEETIGFESLNHFGEYEDDSVFVRNDKMKCDYEILLDERTYAEAVADRRPYSHSREDE